MGGWRLCDGTCRTPLELPQEQETMTPKLWAASMQSCVSRKLLGPAGLPTSTPVGSTGVPTGREGGCPYAVDTLHKTWNPFLHGLCFSTAFSWDLAKHVFPETSAWTPSVGADHELGLES